MRLSESEKLAVNGLALWLAERYEDSSEADRGNLSDDEFGEAVAAICASWVAGHVPAKLQSEVWSRIFPK